MAPKSVFLRNVIELQKRKMIPGDVAEKLSILSDDRLVRALAGLFLDIVELQPEHVDTLLDAESDKEFEAALRNVKCQVAPPSLEQFGRNFFLAGIRFLSLLERTRPEIQPEQTQRGYDFLIEKILPTIILSISLHNKGNVAAQEKFNRMLNDLIHRE